MAQLLQLSNRSTASKEHKRWEASINELFVVPRLVLPAPLHSLCARDRGHCCHRQRRTRPQRTRAPTSRRTFRGCGGRGSRTESDVRQGAFRRRPGPGTLRRGEQACNKASSEVVVSERLAPSMLQHAFSVTAPVVPSNSSRGLAGREGESLRRGPLRLGAKRSDSDTAPTRKLGASTTSSKHATVAASNNREQTCVLTSMQASN